MGRGIIGLVLLLALSGCVSMTPQEQRHYKEIETTNLPCDDVKSPGAAAFLNVLPGIGDFYLASGSGQGHMWAVGALDLLTWPLSIVWAVPQGAVTANEINKKECVYYYTGTIEGKNELIARRKELGVISKMDEEPKIN